MAAKPHAESLVDLADRVDVRAAYSRSAPRRQAFAAQFPFPVRGDLDAIVNDANIDAVLLLTPPNSRIELVERLAGAGKHILMEKPIERTTEAAVQIVEQCERAGVLLGIVFQHRFREASERAQTLIEQGELGELALVNLTVPWWRAQSYYDEPGRGTLARDGGGVLISQAIHSLDLMLSLTGPVVEVTALAGTTRMHRMECEDFVTAGLRFANGALGSVMASVSSYPGRAERLELNGTKASAVLEAGTLALHYLDGREQRFGESQTTGGGADPMAFPHDWHRALLSDFLDAIDGHRGPRVSGRDALKVHKLIDALLLAGRESAPVAVAT